MLKAICAINNQNYLGLNGKMMWRSKEDFKHFKAMTMGGILIVGRKTFENDFNCVGLPGRHCIVIGREYYTPWMAINAAFQLERKIIEEQTENMHTPNIWVVGGASIYSMFMPFIDELHLSRINDEKIGDVTLSLEGFRGNLFEYKFETTNG